MPPTSLSPSSARAASRGDEGITIIEMLVVLGIGALVLVAAATAMPNRDRSLLGDVMAIVDHGRLEAISSGSVVAVEIAGGEIRSGSQSLTLPSGARVHFDTTAPIKRLLWLPDGTWFGAAVVVDTPDGLVSYPPAATTTP